MVNKRMYELGSKSSSIRELFEYAKMRAKEIGGENVYDFSIGNPSVPTPDSVNRAIAEALCDPAVHGYTSAQGDENCRNAVAENLNKRYKTNYSAADIFMTCGAAASLTITFNALTQSNTDEFIAIAPYFPEYAVFVEGAGATFKVLRPDYENFQIDFEELEKLIGKNTKGIIVNSPNNPSGAVYERKSLVRLAELLEKKEKEYSHPIFIICDEPYREIVYSGSEVSHIPSIYKNTILCYSYSKALSLPGERIGYILVPPAVQENKAVYAAVAGAARSLGYVCAPSVFQRMLVKCADEVSDISVYEKNRDILYNGLKEAGITCVHPDGAFYLFLKSPDSDDRAFSKKAMEYDIMLVPGTDFGCPGYLRASYCVDTEMIKRSLPAFNRLMENYR